MRDFHDPAISREGHPISTLKKPELAVSAAVLTDKDKIFIARRPLSDRHGLGGFWEFPGGKLEPGETPEACLIREIREELDVEIAVGPLCLEWTYDYPAYRVLLRAYLATIVAGDVVLRDHDAALWVTRDRLADYPFLPADDILVARLLRMEHP